jgi:hypothetical protein
MTSPPATSNDYQIFGEAGRFLYELAEENKELRKLAAQAEDFKKYKDLYTNKCVEYDEEKQENKRLKEEIQLLRKQQGNGIPHTKFQYVFDTTDFNERMEIGDIERLMDILLELADTKLPKGYLIETSMDIVPIYIMLAERNTFNKHGKSDGDLRNWGIVSLCNCWNNNVVPRIADEKRREELLCYSKEIAKALNSPPWKDSTSRSWNSLYDACGNGNGQISKRKAKLGRAINIKMRLEKLLERIPALKSKKY